MIHPFDPALKLVQARNYTWVDPRKPRKVTLFVMHSMEAANKPTTAEAVASWFAGPNAPQASAHVCADMDSLVACVLPKDIAWSCGGANWCSYSIELAGYAKETRPQWLARENTEMLALAARHLSAAATYFGIPARILDEEEVAECLRDSAIRQGKMSGAIADNPGGLTTHVVVNAAWRNWQEYGLPQPKSDLSHTDPGKDFPMDVLLQMMTPTPEPFPLPGKDNERTA